MKNGEGSKKGMESTVEKSLLVCKFHYSEKLVMSMAEMSEVRK